MQRLLYSYKQAAEMLGYSSPEIIRYLIREGRLRPVHLSAGGNPRIRHRDLEEIADNAAYAAPGYVPEGERPSAAAVEEMRRKIKKATGNGKRV